MTITLLQGDCRKVLASLHAQSVQTVVTSPPYYGLRRYDVEGDQIGDEPTPAEYVAALVSVFDQVWHVLRDDGTLWLNIGDSYANDRKWGGQTGGKHAKGLHGGTEIGRRRTNTGLPSKSLMGIPWRVAFALQDAGWTLRADLIWYKPNCMPESVSDRPTRSHEYLFLFSKCERYYYDADAIREPATTNDKSAPREPRGALSPNAGRREITRGAVPGAARAGQNGSADRDGGFDAHPLGRNKRSVWAINTVATPHTNFATFPERLIEPCILAGSRPGDTVLDPFVGSGTTCRVAERFGRNAIGVDLGYQDLQEKRTDGVQKVMVDLL